MTVGKDDKWKIYKDIDDEWRWNRTAPNGKIVGDSSESYKNRTDCVANAKRMGLKREPKK